MKWSRIDPVLCEGKSGSEAIKNHAAVPEEWTTQQFSMQDAEQSSSCLRLDRKLRAITESVKKQA